MNTTRATLLHRVRDPRDDAAWQRFFDLYAPLLEGFARSFGLEPADAEEIRDQCLAVVAARMPDFEYEPALGSFKAWLRNIARGKVVDWMRRPRPSRAETGALHQLPDPEELDERWERAWRTMTVRNAVRSVMEREDASTRALFAMLLDESLTAAEIGARSGLNENQVYKARSRLLARVRAQIERGESRPNRGSGPSRRHSGGAR